MLLKPIFANEGFRTIEEQSNSKYLLEINKSLRINHVKNLTFYFF